MTVRYIVCLVLLMACSDDVVLNGSDDVIIEAHVRPDSRCALTPESPVVARGTYDLLKTGVKNPQMGVKKEDLPLNYCSNAYELNLRVRNRSDEAIVFESAEVTIEASQGKTIVFDRNGEELPNPFATRTLAPVGADSVGVVTIRAIPFEYGAQLENFRNDEMAVRVVLVGREESGDEIASRPFEFPIQLCFGCLYRCFDADVVRVGGEPDDVYGDECPDDSGADDRICLDPNC